MTLHARDIVPRCLSQVCQRCQRYSLSTSSSRQKRRVLNASLDNIFILVSRVARIIIFISKKSREATEILLRENIDKR